MVENVWNFCRNPPQKLFMFDSGISKRAIYKYAGIAHV
jgi:hypothetical protein